MGSAILGKGFSTEDDYKVFYGMHSIQLLFHDEGFVYCD
jgi:hypothetical protein